MGQRLNIIVLAEGAIDSDGNAITSENVREVKYFCFLLLINNQFFNLSAYFNTT